MVNYKNKLTPSSPGRRGFLTSLVQSVQVILKSAINDPRQISSEGTQRITLLQTIMLPINYCKKQG